MNLNQPNAAQAFFALEAIANFNNFLKTSVDGILAAQGLANSFTDHWIETFSYVTVLEHILEQQNLLLDLLESAFTLIFSFIPEWGGIASSAAAFVFEGVRGSLGSPPEKFDVAADLGAYIGNLTNASTSAISDLGNRLFSSRPDNNGKHLWQYLANGSFADSSNIKAPQVAAFIERQYVAAGIDALWRSQRTYIIATPTVNGISCKNDERGPGQSKLCLTDVPEMVYYAYMIPPTPSDNKKYPQVLLPQGWKNLTDYPGLDLVAVMESSVRAYNVAKFDYEYVRLQRWIGAVSNSSTKGAASPVNEGYGHEGTFTIPVCSDPLGKFISKVQSTFIITLCSILRSADRV